MDDLEGIVDVHVGQARTKEAFPALTHDTMSQSNGDEHEDDEIELELTVEYMNNGHCDMENRDFVAAEENFRLALDLAEAHDFADRLNYGPSDITLILADCLARQDKEEEAMELLESIADGAAQRGLSDVVSLQAGIVRDAGSEHITQLKACHTLATIFLKRADSFAAEKRAQQAFKGRRKVCGPYDPSTLESVELLIEIYTSRNDKTKARAYQRFLEPRTKVMTSNVAPAPTKAPAAAPAFPSVFHMTATATLTEPAPTAFGRVEGNEPETVHVAEYQSRRASASASSFTTTRRLSASGLQLATTDELDNALNAHSKAEGDQDQPGLQLSNSIRAALQTASTSSTLPPSPISAPRPLNTAVPATSILTGIPETRAVDMPQIAGAERLEDQTRTFRAGSSVLATAPAKNAPMAELSSPSMAAITNDSKSARSLSGSDSTVTIPASVTTKSAGSTSVLGNQNISALPHIAHTSQPTVISQKPTTTNVPVSFSISDTTATDSMSTKDSESVGSPSPVPPPISQTKTSSPRRKAVPVRSSIAGNVADVNFGQPLTTAHRVFFPKDLEHSTLEMAQTANSVILPDSSLINASKTEDKSPSPMVRLHGKSTSLELPMPVFDSPGDLSMDLQSHQSKLTSETTADPPTFTMSASQAAFASIFASSGGKPPKRSSSSIRNETLARLSSKSKKADIGLASASSKKLSSLSEETLTALPRNYDATSRSQNEVAVSIDGSSHGDAPPQEESTVHSKTLSWLQDAKLSIQTPISRMTSSSTMNSPSNNRLSDILSSASVRKKAWPLSLSKNKREAQGKSAATVPSPSIASRSLAGSITGSRRDSVSTMESNVEPRRHISFTGSGLSSQPLKRINREFSSTIDRLSRNSGPKPKRLPAQPVLRTGSELATIFALIKDLRTEGKKTAAIDAAIKLLTEYDPERRILSFRESDIKKNIREGQQGLASTGNGYAPIHFFCDQKTEATTEMKLLIDQGADVNAVAYNISASGQEPFTPLQRAIENGHVEIVRLLVDADVAISPPRLEHGRQHPELTSPITHPMLLACRKGQVEITKILLNGGAARFFKEFPHHQWHGNSLLHEACWLADPKMIKMLLDQLLVVRSQYHSSAGPDYESGVIGAPGQQDRFGATPIMYAVDLRDCTSNHMRLQKSARRKDCLKVLLENDIHGDLHSQEYRDNIARVLSTKWIRGPGKGHSIFCYCDEAGDDGLVRLLDPFRYQVSPSARCNANPRCTSNTRFKLNSDSTKSGDKDKQNDQDVPDFPELMSMPVSWPVSANNNGEHYELASNFGSSLPEFEHLPIALGGMLGEPITEEPLSPVTARSNSDGRGARLRDNKNRLSQISGLGSGSGSGNVTRSSTLVV